MTKAKQLSASRKNLPTTPENPWKDFRGWNRKKPSWLVIAVCVLAIAGLSWAAYLRFNTGLDWAEWTGLRGRSFAEWVGLAEFTPPGADYQRGKTLWDWLDLLIVPFFLAIGALLFNRQEKIRELRTAKDHQQQSFLVDYLDKMSELLLKEDLFGKKANVGDPVRRVAQTRTTTVLRILDKSRRKIVIQFLRDAGLVDGLLIGAWLSGADLSDINLYETNLSKADFYGTDLQGALLQKANLQEANLNWANLEGAFLISANLKSAELIWAKLGWANLSAADLSGAHFEQADLLRARVSDEQLSTAASLAGATMPDGSVHE